MLERLRLRHLEDPFFSRLEQLAFRALHIPGSRDKQQRRKP